MTNIPTIPLVAAAAGHASRSAIIADDGRYTYDDLLDQSARAATTLLAGRDDLDESRVAFLAPPSMAHVVTQWGIWRAGGIAVPLCLQHPAPELEYTITDSDAEIVVAHPDWAERVRSIAERRGCRFLLTTELPSPGDAPLPPVGAARRAMLIYTSGTTNKPKGTVSTHAMVAAQVGALVEAWGWTGDDHILHVLPLHHVHGVVNVLCCALWSGARCEILPSFDVDRVWQRLAADDGITLFMAVPTIYARLIRAWNEADEQQQRSMSAGCRQLRLMVSGSAALPVSTLERWQTISGHTLLERYGMTEIGMALSNPLHGERRPGCVGTPLPGVDLRLVDEHDQLVYDGVPGQIQVRGPAVFTEYWRRPEATSESFTDDGWFLTGDVSVREDGVYRILGRESVDIIKTGGYKVSALEIEDVLRTHEEIDECAVVGVEDEEWGQRVAAVVVLREGGTLELEPLRTWSKQRLAAYKVPTLLKVLDELPRNPMGKVTKPDLMKLFSGR